MANDKDSLVIHNKLKGSWIKVVDGEGRILAKKVKYGNIVTIRVECSMKLELLALAYSLTDNQYMGSATATRNPWFNRGQLEPWLVKKLKEEA